MHVGRALQLTWVGSNEALQYSWAHPSRDRDRRAHGHCADQLKLSESSGPQHNKRSPGLLLPMCPPGFSAALTSFNEARISKSGLRRANSAAKAQRSMPYFRPNALVLLVMVEAAEADPEDVVRRLPGPGIGGRAQMGKVNAQGPALGDAAAVRPEPAAVLVTGSALGAQGFGASSSGRSGAELWNYRPRRVADPTSAIAPSAVALREPVHM